MIKAVLKSIADSLGYRIQSTKYIPRPFLQNLGILKLDFDHVLSKYLVESGDPNRFRFIQVGAFDGVECDPLRKYLLKYNWDGILLEPQPLPYSKLKMQYEGRAQLKIVNAAVSRENGKAELFILEGNDLPEWTKGMASFQKENILKHEYLVKDLASHIRKVEIDTISFNSLFEKSDWTSLDLLQVDTEGFDAEVIRMFPFDRIKPAIIHFECKHIQKADLENLLAMLIEKGYSVAYDREEDMVAVLRDIKQVSA